MATIRSLGVLLCYNDVEMLEDALLYLLNNNHDLIVWDHGSDDGTAEVLDKYGPWLAERTFIPRSFDPYRLYQHMSQHLITGYIHQYDWISWPDQDELLEGPDRSKTYAAWVATIFEQGYDYVQFNNFNFWPTTEDDPGILSPVERVRHYGLFPDCAPRIRAWRAAVTNIRLFNHNDLPGQKLPFHFNLRHYPMRTQQQIVIPPGLLHFDNGISNLNPQVKYNWRDIYGDGPGDDPSAGAGDGLSPDPGRRPI